MGKNKSNEGMSHLTLEERRTILKGIEMGLTKKAIGNSIGKDNSTIGKEIKLHREEVKGFAYAHDCESLKKCIYDHACQECNEYVPYTCTRRDRTPGACNGCRSFNSCKHRKYVYNPEEAQEEYETLLSGCRSGINMLESEFDALAKIICPLIKQGQSIYSILQSHPEIQLTEKTIYNYINADYFHDYDVTKLDLRLMVRRRDSMSKKRTQEYKKRLNRKCFIGREYSNYREYRDTHPEAYTVQMDTVYNDISNGPFVQTFLFIEAGIFFAIYHTDKTSDSMTEGVDLLEEILGSDIFRKYVEILLTDRGPEFCDAEGMEHSEDGSVRTHVFYCDPMRSNQKGSLENRHLQLRYILPKHSDFTQLGLASQTDMNIISSHLNSTPVEKMNGKSAYEYAELIYPDLMEKLHEYGICQIDKDSVLLRPNLLKLLKKEDDED